MRLVPVVRERTAVMVLYDLLKERPPEAAISHKTMPTLEEHAAFVRSQPYMAWYLVEVDGYVGSIYLSTRREIGVFIFRAHQGKGYGRQAIALLREKWPGRMLANVAPGNEASHRLFQKMGGRVIQHTYELPVDGVDRGGDADDQGHAHSPVKPEQGDSGGGATRRENEPDEPRVVPHGHDAT